MVVSTADLGLRLVAYGALLVAIPLSFVVLFQVIDRLALDGLVEQYEEASPEPRHGFDATPTVAHDGVICPKCGEHNEPEYTFCRSCQARIGG